jgi:hypothetical protein
MRRAARGKGAVAENFQDILVRNGAVLRMIVALRLQ